MRTSVTALARYGGGAVLSRRSLAFVSLLALGCGGNGERIAWVGPASTPSGQQAVRGIRIYLEQSRAPVTLDIYDDQNDPALARTIANEIADSRATAVIGHHRSECAIAAAEVYRDREIPFITAYATDPRVTRDNRWAFRALPNDHQTARVLAHYVVSVWPDRPVTFIGSAGEAVAFGEGWKKAGGGAGEYVFDADAVPLDRPVVITETPTASADILRRLRQRGFASPIVFGKAATTTEFFERLGDPTLANGVHVASTYDFDVADKNGGQFYRDFTDRHGDLPTWEAAVASDAIAMIVETLSSVVATDGPGRRKALRDSLDRSRGVRATTGVVWFDGEGDRNEPVAMGVLHNRKAETALVQIYPLADGVTHIQSNVVLAGVRALSFEEVDFEAGTFVADVFLWFRHRPSVSIDGLVVLNAIEPVAFDEPDVEREGDGWIYRLYRVRTKLKTDYFAAHYGEHVLAMSYRHDTLTREKLFFARDSIGMGVQTARNNAERLAELERLLDPGLGYRVVRRMLFEDGYIDHSLGDPSYLDREDKTLEYSRYNLGLIVAPRGLTPRRSLSLSVSKWATGVSAGVLLLTLLLGRAAAPRRRRWLFALQIVSAFALLIAVEVIAGQYLLTQTGHGYLRHARLLFDSAWWFVPAGLLARAFVRFVWDPLESSTGRAVPTILKHFVTFTIFLLAMFGIVAFVFDQKLTSLLATSGVVAMIIGLAIQINITNIFSGIALNLERPFKVGDWIMIHGRTPEPHMSIIGCVVDINWRTTRLKTTSRSIVVVPNGAISEKTITNFMSPSEVSRFELIFTIDSSEPTDRVLATIRDALSAIAGKGLLDDPASKVRIDRSSPDGIHYSVRYFIVPREFSPSKARHLVTEAVVGRLHGEGIKLANNPRDIRYRAIDGPPLDADVS